MFRKIKCEIWKTIFLPSFSDSVIIESKKEGKIMLEVNMDRRLLLVLIGVFAVVGVISKCVVSISLKSLMKAAGNMGKSSHSLMRLVRAKYELSLIHI